MSYIYPHQGWDLLKLRGQRLCSGMKQKDSIASAAPTELSSLAVLGLMEHRLH